MALTSTLERSFEKDFVRNQLTSSVIPHAKRANTINKIVISDLKIHLNKHNSGLDILTEFFIFSRSFSKSWIFSSVNDALIVNPKKNIPNNIIKK